MYLHDALAGATDPSTVAVEDGRVRTGSPESLEMSDVMRRRCLRLLLSKTSRRLGYRQRQTKRRRIF